MHSKVVSKAIPVDSQPVKIRYCASQEMLLKGARLVSNRLQVQCLNFRVDNEMVITVRGMSLAT